MSGPASGRKASTYLHSLSARILLISLVGVAAVVAVTVVNGIASARTRQANALGDCCSEMSEIILRALILEEQFARTGDAERATGIRTALDTLLQEMEDAKERARAVGAADLLLEMQASATTHADHFGSLEPEVLALNEAYVALGKRYATATTHLRAIIDGLVEEEAQLSLMVEDLPVAKAALRDQCSQFLGYFQSGLANVQALLLNGDPDAYTAARDALEERQKASRQALEMQVQAVGDDAYSRPWAAAKAELDAIPALQEELFGHWTRRRDLAAQLAASSDEIQALARQAAATTARVAADRQAFATTVGYASVVAAALALVGLSLWIGRSITRPIGQAVDLAGAIAEGDLSQRMETTRRDETGALGRALDGMADALERKARLARAIAEGDLTRDVVLAGDRDLLGHALVEMVESLNDIVGSAHEVAGQVSAGTRQLSASSQSLSDDAGRQAASLEEISSSLSEIESRTNANAEHAGEAERLGKSSRDAAETGNRQMAELVTSMNEMNEAATAIGKIIKTIDDIAFQTNLLALNAAVEAAQAGKYGKGFAVVAQEVRNLAGRSAKSAAETAELIEATVEKVQHGVASAQTTAETLQEIVERISRTTELVAEIAAATAEQARGIAEVNTGLSQVESVTQQNTANAEETAAAARELAGLAEDLNQTMRRFRLREEAGGEATDGAGWAEPPRDDAEDAAVPTTRRLGTDTGPTPPALPHS